MESSLPAELHYFLRILRSSLAESVSTYIAKPAISSCIDEACRATAQKFPSTTTTTISSVSKSPVVQNLLLMTRVLATISDKDQSMMLGVAGQTFPQDGDLLNFLTRWVLEAHQDTKQTDRVKLFFEVLAEVEKQQKQKVVVQKAVPQNQQVQIQPAVITPATSKSSEEVSAGPKELGCKCEYIKIWPANERRPAREMACSSPALYVETTPSREGLKTCQEHHLRWENKDEGEKAAMNRKNKTPIKTSKQNSPAQKKVTPSDVFGSGVRPNQVPMFPEVSGSTPVQVPATPIPTFIPTPQPATTTPTCECLNLQNGKLIKCATPSHACRLGNHLCDEHAYKVNSMFESPCRLPICQDGIMKACDNPSTHMIAETVVCKKHVDLSLETQILSEALEDHPICGTRFVEAGVAKICKAPGNHCFLGDFLCKTHLEAATRKPILPCGAMVSENGVATQCPVPGTHTFLGISICKGHSESLASIVTVVGSTSIGGDEPKPMLPENTRTLQQQAIMDSFIKMMMEDEADSDSSDE